MTTDDAAAGGYIHEGDPFAAAAAERDPVRQFRGRQPSAVTLWTAAHGRGRAGLTVASVAMTDPGRLLGVVGEESELLPVLRAAGSFVVTPLGWPQRRLADVFGYVAPAPGGPFRVTRWRDTRWGPVPEGSAGWAGCRLVAERAFGFGVAVEAEIEHAEGDPEDDPLVWHRGRYRHLRPG